MEKCERVYYNHNGKNIYFEYYYKDEKLHRDNLPAIMYYYENGNIARETYYKDGSLHREDGPAYIHYCDNGEIDCMLYYLNEIEYTDKDIIDNWVAFCKMQIFL